MEDVQNAILAVVDANGGRVLYQTVKDALQPGQVQQLPRAMKDLKRRGIAMNQNRMNEEGAVVFEIFRLG